MPRSISNMSTQALRRFFRLAVLTIGISGFFVMTACKGSGSSEKTEELALPPPPPPEEIRETLANKTQEVAAPMPSASSSSAVAPEASPSASGPVRGTASLGGMAVTGGGVSNAHAVVAGMGAGFRRCYNRGLQANPAMKGSLRITARIGRTGEVASATPSGGQGLSDEVVRCLVSRVESAQFAPPEGGGATIVIPVTLVAE